MLASQAAAIAETRPGRRFIDGHDAAVRVLAQGMLDTGLLDYNKVGTLGNAMQTDLGSVRTRGGACRAKICANAPN